jgi:hypothetical protein
MRIVLAGVALAFAAGVAVAQAPAPAAAPESKCKEVVTAKSRSTAQMSDAARERRAKDKAISNWSRRARSTYGWRYSFWRSAEEKQVDCGGGAKSKHCTVSAKPCRLL